MAKTLGGGKEIRLSNVQSFEISASLETPVVALALMAECESFPPEFGAVRLFKDEMELFCGKTDLQRAVYSKSGIVIRIEARNNAAVLLDNEAMPQTLWGVNLATIFARHIGKYGFALVHKVPSTTAPVFKVQKVMSQWNCFCSFAGMQHGIMPFVSDGQVYCAKISESSPIFFFENGKSSGAERYTEFSYTAVPYEVVSRVYLRDEQGQYLSYMDNAKAGYYEAERVRYMVPSNGLEEYMKPDAERILKESLAGVKSWRLKTDSLLMPRLARTVGVKGAGFEALRLVISGYRQSVGRNGEETVLELKEAMSL